MDEQLRARIESILHGNTIVLFMKGTKSFPQCGFSHAAVEILKRVNADFQTVDILRDPDLRQGLKEYANWATYPQLWIEGRLVGGSDILREMFESGELQPVVDRALGRASS